MTRGIVLAALVLIGVGLASSAMAQSKTAGTSQGNTVGQGDTVGEVGSQYLRPAPIGHRQPRPRDLPPGTAYDRGKTPAERALDRGLIICRC